MNNLYRNRYFGYCNGKRCIHCRELYYEELDKINMTKFAYMQELFQIIPVIKTEHFRGIFFADMRWHPAFETPECMNVCCEFEDVFLVCDYVHYSNAARQRAAILRDGSSNLYGHLSEVIDEVILDDEHECIDDERASLLLASTTKDNTRDGCYE